MSNEEIERFLVRQNVNESHKVKITFKKRNTLYGIFLRGKDFGELKHKNFWRIVTGAHADEWHEKKNMDNARIFSGADFSSLAIK